MLSLDVYACTLAFWATEATHSQEPGEAVKKELMRGGRGQWQGEINVPRWHAGTAHALSAAARPPAGNWL